MLLPTIVVHRVLGQPCRLRLAQPARRGSGVEGLVGQWVRGGPPLHSPPEIPQLPAAKGAWPQSGTRGQGEVPGSPLRGPPTSTHPRAGGWPRSQAAAQWGPPQPPRAGGGTPSRARWLTRRTPPSVELRRPWGSPPGGGVRRAPGSMGGTGRAGRHAWRTGSLRPHRAPTRWACHQPTHAHCRALHLHATQLRSPGTHNGPSRPTCQSKGTGSGSVRVTRHASQHFQPSHARLPLCSPGPRRHRRRVGVSRPHTLWWQVRCSWVAHPAVAGPVPHHRRAPHGVDGAPHPRFGCLRLAAQSHKRTTHTLGSPLGLPPVVTPHACACHWV